MYEYPLAQQLHLQEFWEKIMHKDAQVIIICEQ